MRYPIYFTRKVALFINFSIWCSSSVIFILGHVIFEVKIAMMKDALICAFAPEQSDFILAIIISGFVIPACVIFICAVILYNIVRQQISQIRALEGAASQLPNHASLVSHLNAIKTIFCMVGGYYICWGPVMIFVWVWSYIYGNSISPKAEAITGWFAMCNCMCNSLVYLPTMREYRRIFKSIFIPKMCTSDNSG